MSSKPEEPKRLILKLKRTSNQQYKTAPSETTNDELYKEERQAQEDSRHTIPLSVVNILKNCTTPSRAMEEMLTEGLVGHKIIWPSSEAQSSERTEMNVTADQIAKKLRKSL